jgi:hypothetical protein
MAHFEEVVEDDDKFHEIGGKSSANDIFWTVATHFLSEASAREHLFCNWSLPNCEAPVLRSLESTLVCGLKLWFWEVVIGAVVPDIDAPEGSGEFGFIVIDWHCLGHVPDVDRVGDE